MSLDLLRASGWRLKIEESESSQAAKELGSMSLGLTTCFRLAVEDRRECEQPGGKGTRLHELRTYYVLQIGGNRGK